MHKSIGADGLTVVIVANPEANPPGLDGEPQSVRDAYDALYGSGGTGGRK